MNILMEKIEILSLVVTIICLLSFSIVFTILFRNYNLNAIDSIKNGNEDIDLIDSCLIEEQKQHSKKHKAMRIVSKIVYFTLYGAVLGFFGFSLASRIMDNNMLIGDKGIVVIATGSMSEQNKDNTYLKENNLDDQFNAYDIIQIRKYKENESPKQYDVIAFKDKHGRTIVHRIIEFNTNTDGKTTYVTRGDSNNASDVGSLYDELTRDQIIGKYTGKNVPAIGSFVIFLQSNSGIITIVSIGYCVFMFDYYRNKLEKTIVKRTNLLVELIDYDENNPEVTNTFTQELVYKGYVYSFSKGEFLEKRKLDDTALTDATTDKMYTKTVDNNQNSEVKVKNIKEDKIETIQSDPLDSLDELIKERNESKEIKIENKDSNDTSNALDSLDELLNTTKK